MINNQESFRQWISGVAATIIAGVVVWYLTEGTKAPQTSSPNSSSPNIEDLKPPNTERWRFMGISTNTNEAVYVDNTSISKSGGTTNFTYKIGNDLINANAECERNRWHSVNKNTGEDYGWNSPQSQGTQSMMNYVCKP